MADSEQRSAAGVGPKARRDELPKAGGDESPKARGDQSPKARNGGSPQAGDDHAPPEPATVGQLLERARVAQDLSVEQLAAELRIEARQLAALEQNRFAQIGVPVFVKGYIKQYGTRLGLDPADLLAAYYKQGKLEDIDIRPSRAIQFRDEQPIRGWVVALIVLLLIVAGLAVWWLNDAGWGRSVAPAPPERSEPAAVPAAALPGAARRVPDAAAGAAARVDVEVPPPATEPSAQPTPTAGPPAAAPPTDAAARPQPEARAAALRPLEFAVDVEIAFDQESWTEITDARGERLFYGMGSAGRRVTLRGEPPFSVVLGNVDGVRLSVEGADYEIPRPRQGNFARFTLKINEE